MTFNFKKSGLVAGIVLAAGVVLGWGVFSVGVRGDDGAAGAEKGLKIGLIVSGTVSDGGWNQLAWEGAKKLQEVKGTKVSKLEKVDVSKAAGEMRDYAQQGYDLVIGHGFEFADPATEVAKTETKMKLVVSGYPEAKPGVMTLDFDLSQPCYQLGIIAARVSKTGKLGFIGGEKIPSLVACLAGFEAGAKSVRGDVSVVAAYTSWDRPELSKSQSEAFFQQGVDVILQNVDAASRGVFEAVKEHNDAGGNTVYVFGTNGNQNDNAICPEVTLGSAVIRLDLAFARVAAAVRDGSFKEGLVEENLANGVCVTVVNPKLVESGVIGKGVVTEVEEAGKKLVSGEIKVPAGN